MKQRSKLSLSPRGGATKKPPPGFAEDASNDDDLETSFEDVPRREPDAAGVSSAGPSTRKKIPSGPGMKKLLGVAVVVAVGALTLYLVRRRSL